MAGSSRMAAWSALMLSTLTCSCHGSSPAAPSTGGQSIVVNGVPRTYSVHVPASFSTRAGALVVALHGAGDNGPSFERTTGLSFTADQAGFAVVYPDGLFNPRIGASDWQHYGDDFTDDVSFLRQLISTLSASLQTDPRRTYVVGFSDGGRLAERAGVELSDQIAAIGDVGGSLFQGGVPPIPHARAPVSVVILHGDADAYCGLPADASQQQTFDYWTGGLGDNCLTINPTAALCDNLDIPTAVADKSGESCSAGSAVKLYRLFGGGHAWYGSVLNVPGQTPFNPDLGAATGTTVNEIVWNFFALHPKF